MSTSISGFCMDAVQQRYGLRQGLGRKGSKCRVRPAEVVTAVKKRPRFAPAKRYIELSVELFAKREQRAASD
jgi:hypothetical protein